MDEINRRMNAYKALMDLQRILNTSMSWTPLFDMTDEEKDAFKHDHPGALCVIGDFEIKCLNPEKYNL